MAPRRLTESPWALLEELELEEEAPVVVLDGWTLYLLRALDVPRPAGRPLPRTNSREILEGPEVDHLEPPGARARAHPRHGRAEWRGDELLLEGL